MITKNNHRSLLENDFSVQSQEFEKLNVKELLEVMAGIDEDLDEDNCIYAACFSGSRGETCLMSTCVASF